MPKDDRFEIRTTGDQRDRWKLAAQEQGQDASAFARDALDAWTKICARARELGMEPRDLLAVRVLGPEGRRRG
jgi:uncharacterized protein (DUF1778 family)